MLEYLDFSVESAAYMSCFKLVRRTKSCWSGLVQDLIHY